MSATYDKQHPESIQTLFDRVAQNYDRGNAILSLGMHKLWDASLVQQVVIPQKPNLYLDLCAGTGAISFRYLEQCPHPPKTVLLDFSSEMLECARKKAETRNWNKLPIEYIQADAQSIPMESCTTDCVTMAYGIRNIKNPQQCLEEIYRVLKPGGSVGILELTRPSRSFLRWGHSLYLRLVLPTVGRWILGEGQAYQYLCQSIHDFVQPSVLLKSMETIGFQSPQAIPLLGGVATILTAKKASGGCDV